MRVTDDDRAQIVTIPDSTRKQSGDTIQNPTGTDTKWNSLGRAAQAKRMATGAYDPWPSLRIKLSDTKNASNR
ncbi:MAG: hypothetical protein JWN70_7178 [Planctomycetaceae bacterium]|nr:hypothetical protein [Planctomycetaceae bacterium]